MEVFEVSIVFNEAIKIDATIIDLFAKNAKSQGYSNVIEAGNNVACFDTGKTNTRLNSQQFVYTINSPEEEDINVLNEKMVNIISGIINLDEQSCAYIKVIDINKCEYDVYGKSKENSNMIFKPNIKGLGYRYFIEYDHGLSEFKAEPLLKEKNTWFFEATYNFDISKQKNHITNFIKQKIDDFICEKTAFMGIYK